MARQGGVGSTPRYRTPPRGRAGGADPAGARGGQLPGRRAGETSGMPRHVAGPEGGGNGKRAGGRGLGGRDGGTEDARGRSLRRVPPGLVGWKVAVRDEDGAGEGGSSSASSLRGADLRGDVAVHRGGRGDGGARGRVRWAGESCSGATTRARRRGGRLRQRAGGSLPSTTRPELVRMGGRVAVPRKVELVAWPDARARLPRRPAQHVRCIGILL